MSKAKKFISMLLAVAMVLTAAPVSLVAYADDVFTAGEISFSKPEFTVSTSGTTEVIRVASGAGSFATGNYIVAATDSGIPQADSGYYIDVAYAGETPYRPQVVFAITGATPSEVSVTPSIATITLTASDPVTSDGTTTYTYTVNTGSTATTGTDVVYTITYKVGGQSYTAYAFSHVEDILVMTGFITHRKEIYSVFGTTSKNDTYMGAIVQLASKNMYSGMSDTSEATNRAKGYVNYAAQGNSSTNYLWETGEAGSATYETLTGTGPFDDFGSSDASYAKAANTDSGEVGVLIKVNDKARDDRANLCTADDSNRGEATVYIDKRNEIFGADASGKDGLNLRVSAQTIEDYRNSYIFVASIGLYDGYQTFGSTDSVPTSTITAPLSVTTNTAQVTVTTVNDSKYYNWSYSYFSGDPSSMSTNTSDKPWTEYSMIVDIQGKNDEGSISNYTQSAGGINLNIGVYDTRDLYNLYNGIMTGTSMTCVTDTYASVGAINFTNGVNPQSFMYSSGWSDFVAAFKTAGSILVKPDTNQTEIDSAAGALYTAYFNLGGYNANVNYEIKYNLANADGTDSGVAVPGAVIQTGTKAAGTTVTVAPATILGYTVTNSSTKTLFLPGNSATESVTFLYTPNKYQLVAYSNGTAGTQFYEKSYGDTVDVSTLEYGTKEFFQFDGWYDTNGTSTGSWGNKLSTFTMPMSNYYIYGKWSPAPLTISAIPVVDGQELTGSDGSVIVKELGTVTPDEDTTKTVEFARPADLEVEGYLFVEYFETFEDGTLSNPVSWPLSFTLGDSDKTIYARMVDVSGKVIFESNGGTAVEDIEFTPTATIEAPTAPTKDGYTFEQWYYDRDLTNPITWPVELTTETGFIAYAGWTANDVEITFDLGDTTTKYDTAEIAPIKGKADAVIPEYDYPVTPLKFGYVFDGWALNGVRYEFDGTNVMPKTSIELTALWRATDYSAFIEIDSYEKLSGEAVETSTASIGDVVTFRMSSLTNFYTGSSVFVFMYDTNFFELVNTGSSAFTLNTDSEYISGIDAKKQGVTNSSSLPWPEGLDSTNYAAMMVAIDPKVTASNYNCEPMSDGEWIVEFQLRVKEGATGEGKVYMDNAWTRSIDNIMGTMFYGWGEKKTTSVADTTNNVVVPNLDEAYAIITIDETTPPDTTLTLKANNGAWADGSVEKSYTGRTETEILDYVAPTREGYTLTSWIKEGDETVTWAEGYYAKEADDGIVYVAQWTPIEYEINFYTEQTDGELYHNTAVGYELPITAPTDPEKVGYDFAGWVDTDGNAVDFAAGVNCPLGGADYFATWTPSTDTEYKIVAKYYNQVTSAYNTLSTTMTGTTGYTVQIVEAVPETQEADTIYITVADLPKVQNGNYVYDPDNNTLPITGVIAADGSTTIEVNYIGKEVTFTYSADGGTWEDGTTADKTETKTFQTIAEGPGADPTKVGYTFAGWNPNFVLGTTRLNQNRTFTAKWTANEYTATFNAVNGDLAGAFDDATTVQTASVAYGSAITAPATPSLLGYTFKGWATTEGGAVAELGTMDSVDGKVFYAVYEPTVYNIDYYVDGVYQYSDTAIMNETVTLRANPTQTGYTFSGWKVDGAGDAVTEVTMGTAAITLEGTFTPNSYDVIFDADGGYFDGDTSVTTKAVSTEFDSAITKPETDPVRTGYEFLGWTDTKGSTTLITSFGTLTTTETVTYYAVWKATYANYTINVYYQDVTGAYPADADESTTSSGLVESTVSVNPDEKTGFTLDTANSVTSGTVLADGSLALTVKYIRNKYTLSTDVDGVITEVGEYYYQSTITEPEKPTKTGYTCTGWSNLPSDMKILTDTVIVAQWEANPYTVTFYADSTMQGTPLYTATLAYKTEYPVPTATKTGYTFKAWVDSATGSEVTLASTETIPAADTTYYATWTVNEYTLTYRTYNAIYEQFDVAYGTAAADMPVPDVDPTREGYVFKGWAALPETMPAEETVITSSWAKETYTLSFNTDGGSIIEDMSVTFGEDIEIPANPTKEGYTFTGWDSEIPETIPDLGENGAVITYTAQWSINKYNITWNITDEGTYKTDTDVEYGTVITAPTPTKQGYVFSGWEGYTEGMTMPDNALTFTGSWAPATDTAYTVYIHTMGTDGEYVTETQNLTGTTGETANAEYTVAEGFELGANSITSGTIAADGSLVLNVYLDRKTVTITFDSNGGSAVAAITQLYGTSVTEPTAPTLAGYTFTGWNPEVPETMPSADVTLVAQWSINKYNITWNITDEGTYKTDTDVEYGTVITAPTPTKQGYVFSGWEGYTEGMTMPDNALTFTGSWSPATDTAYTVYIHTMGTDGEYATETKNLTGTTGETANAEYTVAEGFELGTNSVTSGTIAADGSLELNVYIDRREVTITFDSNGGSDVEAIVQLYGTAVTAPADPTREGYEFGGWDVTVPGTMPAADMVITASWNINSYVVTFVDANDESFAEFTLEYMSAISAPADSPVKEYYTFKGWSLTKIEGILVEEDLADITLIDFENAAPTVPANDITIYPVFVRVPVTLALVADSTAVVDTTAASETINGYIYGLETKLSKTKLLDKYLSVEGDGELIVTLTKYGVCGTGTKIEVYDNVEQTVVETYYIIVFGDINGDSAVSAADSSMINAETLNVTSWSVEGSSDYDYCKVMAADIAGTSDTATTLGDGRINTADEMAVVDTTLFVSTINQVTGKADLI